MFQLDPNPTQQTFILQRFVYLGIFLVSTECHERVSLKKTILDNDGFRSFFQISDPEEFYNRSRIGKYILAFGISRILAISVPSETAYSA